MSRDIQEGLKDKEENTRHQETHSRQRNNMNKSTHVTENSVFDSNGKAYMTKVLIFGSGTEMGRESEPHNSN